MQKEVSTHSGHPGYLAGDCICRKTINRSPFGSMSNGYACLHTGGHCLPSDKCEKMRESYKKFLEEREEDTYYDFED